MFRFLRKKRTAFPFYDHKVNPNGLKISFPGSQLDVGAFTYGYRKMRVKTWGEGANLKIGKFCSIASGVEIILGGNHRVDWISTYPFGHIFQDHFPANVPDGHPATKGDVLIGNDVWIAADAKILSGVKIGDGAVIGASSVVSKDVAPYEIVAGNPAQPVKSRFDEETVALLLELRWWDLNPKEDITNLAAILSSRPEKTMLKELVAKFRSETAQPLS